MVRQARVSEEQIIDSVTRIVAEDGPAAVTIGALARRLGIPTGSIYHRFASRAAILGQAWLGQHRSLVHAVLPRLNAGDPCGAALALVDWAGGNRMAARFLLLNDSEDLLGEGLPEDLRCEIAAQQDEIDAAFLKSCGPSPEEFNRVKFQVFDGPVALMRPYLLSGQAFPNYLRDMILHMFDAPVRAAQ